MTTLIKVTYIDTPAQRYLAIYNATGVELVRVVRTVRVA